MRHYFLTIFFSVSAFYLSSLSVLAGPCDQIQSHIMIEKCYGQLAAEKNDSSLCDKYVMGHCHAAFAIVKKNPSICEKLKYPVTKDFCYFDVALETKDILQCDKITSQDTKYSCYVKVDPVKYSSLCDKIKYVGIRDHCYEDIALIKDDLPLCQKITSSGIRDKCYYQVALLERNLKVCDQINDEYVRKICPREVKIRLEQFPLQPKQGGQNAANGN